MREPELVEPISDPRLDEPIRGNEMFELTQIAKFQAGKGDHPSRHYRQSALDLRPDELQGLLKKLTAAMPKGSSASEDRPPLTAPQRVTIIGGYTGEFAHCLQKLGHTVFFTDPIREHVDAAKAKHGLAGRPCRVELLTGKEIAETDLFATFECYPFLVDPRTFAYTAMRLLSCPNGLLFAESATTFEEIKTETERDAGRAVSVKGAFLGPMKVYGCNRTKRSLADRLNLYHFFLPSGSRETIEQDCRILRALSEVDVKPDPHGDIILDHDVIRGLATVASAKPQRVLEAVRRFVTLYASLDTFSLRYCSFDFTLFSKAYRLSGDLRARQ